MSNALATSRVSREGVDMEKVAHFLKVVRGHTRGADAYLDKFAHFDVEKLRTLTGKRIHNLLVDVDACIAPAYGPILEENLVHADLLLQQGLGIGIYSNCKSGERLTPLYDMGIRSYEGKHAKPKRQGFLDACDEFGFDPASTWMIGENPNTDGGAIGVLEGMAFVKPVPEDLKILSMKKRIVLPVQRALRGVAIHRTLSGNSSILRSEHLG